MADANKQHLNSFAPEGSTTSASSAASAVSTSVTNADATVTATGVATTSATDAAATATATGVATTSATGVAAAAADSTGAAAAATGVTAATSTTGGVTTAADSTGSALGGTANPTPAEIGAAAAAWAAMEAADEAEENEGDAANLPYGYSGDSEHVTGATAIVHQAIAEAAEFDNAAVKARLQPIAQPDNAGNPHLFQADRSAKESVDAPHLRILGHWFYDQNQGFLLDEVTAKIFAIDDYHAWHDPQEILGKISSFDAARFWLTMKLRIMGDVVFEKITFTQGPYNGQSFIVQGSILARDKKSQAICATGYISHESSPYSEFIPREISGDGMFLINIKTDEMIGSASFHKMLGYSAEEFPKTNSEMHEKLLHPDDIDVVLVQNQIVTTNIYGDYYECCVRLKHKDGHYIWTIGRALVLDRDEKNVATQLIGTQTDINLVQTNFDNMKLMMFNDSLTGLHNRTYFQQNALRYDDPELQPLSVLFVDVTGLKLTNDILGHSYGDYLIIKTCEIIRQALSEELSEMLNAQYNDQEEVNTVLSELNSSLQSNSKYESQDQQHLNYLLETQTPNDPPNFDLFDVYQQALQTNTDTAAPNTNEDAASTAADFFAMDPAELDRHAAEDPAASSNAADFFAMDPSELDPAKADNGAGGNAADFFAMDPSEFAPTKGALPAAGANAADFFAMDPAELDPSRKTESAPPAAGSSAAAVSAASATVNASAAEATASRTAISPTAHAASDTSTASAAAGISANAGSANATSLSAKRAAISAALKAAPKKSEFDINSFTAKTVAQQDAANISAPNDKETEAVATTKRAAFSSTLVDPQSDSNFDINAFTAKTLKAKTTAATDEDEDADDDFLDKPAFLAKAKPEAPNPDEFNDPKSQITLSRYQSNSSQAMGFSSKQSVAATSALESTRSSRTLLDEEEKAKTKTSAPDSSQGKNHMLEAATAEGKDASFEGDGKSVFGKSLGKGRADDSEKERQRLSKLQEALISSGLDILRLAGDEFLVILPHCTMEQAQDIAQRIKKVRDAHNAYHEQHTPIEERSVPVYFGVGVASYNDMLPADAPEKRGAKRTKAAKNAANADETAPKDNIKRIIERADARMQSDKEANRYHDYSLLKEYFEEKKGRVISMRDERRYSYLSKDERQSIRTQRNSNYII